MALGSAQNYPGLSLDGIRRLDRLEAGIRDKPQRVPGTDRIRLHGPGGKIGGLYDIVLAWTVVFVGSASAGAIIRIFAARGH